MSAGRLTPVMTRTCGGQHIGHVGQQQIDEVHTDPVEHDGGDDLIDVEIRLEQARENAPDRTAGATITPPMSSGKVRNEVKRIDLR